MIQKNGRLCFSSFYLVDIFLTLNHLWKVLDLINRLAEAAKQTEGTFSFRNGKLFGNFIIIVNKSQGKFFKNRDRSLLMDVLNATFWNILWDISGSDEEALELLTEMNPSLITTIKKYFNGGPEVVLLPVLTWDLQDQPNFNEDGIS